MAQKYDDESLVERGQRRATTVIRQLDIEPSDLASASVLEIGCGFGELTGALADLHEAHPVGIDPRGRFKNGPFADRDIFINAGLDDISQIRKESFQFIVSYDVFEHIPDPKNALTHVFKLLKPGGRAFLKYNLHRGATSSHVAHIIDFPWCQLLLPHHRIDAKVRLATQNRRGGPEPVNFATWAHYLCWSDEIGFERLAHWYIKCTMSDEFYESFKETLMWYPKEDLERNFMCMRLQKPHAG